MEAGKSIMLNKAAAFAQNVYLAIQDKQNDANSKSAINQLIRAADSVGANLSEAISAYTVKDKIYKFSIAYKEAVEVDWWLGRLNAAGVIDPLITAALSQEVDEIRKMIYSARRTFEKKLNK